VNRQGPPPARDCPRDGKPPFGVAGGGGMPYILCAMSDCPCCSGRAYEECCEPLLLGRTRAETAEALMRSRYSAYTLAEIDYLYRTSGPRVRREFDAESCRKWAQSAEWTGFEMLRSEAGGARDEAGEIEFVAHYSVKDAPFDHHEIATFGRVNGEWCFLDGKIIGPPPVRRESPKVGRNDPCPCGSGQKYKKCCGHKPAAEPESRAGDGAPAADARAAAAAP